MTARLAHISDTHVCQASRPEDLLEVLEAFLAAVEEAEVDLIVHAGDFFDRLSTPDERLALALFLGRASTIAPVFGVKGNHDAKRDLDIFNRLETDHPVVIADRPTLPGGSVPMGPFACLALPWFDKAHLVSGLPATVDAETTRLAVIEEADKLLIGLSAEAERVKTPLKTGGRIPILVGHVMVAGSTVGSGQTIQGITVELSPHDIQGVGAEYAALGHVHMRQEWFGGRVSYSGSPRRNNFGEPEEKGWNLVTFDDEGRFVSNEFRPLPARQIVLLEFDFRDGAVANNKWPDLSPPGVAGALVRLRYKARPQDLPGIDEASIEKFLRDAGAADVKLEALVEHGERVRSEDIAKADSTIDKCEAFWKAKGEEFDEATRGRLGEKVADLETEVPR